MLLLLLLLLLIIMIMLRAEVRDLPLHARGGPRQGGAGLRRMTSISITITVISSRVIMITIIISTTLIITVSISISVTVSITTIITITHKSSKGPRQGGAGPRRMVTIWKNI